MTGQGIKRDGQDERWTKKREHGNHKMIEEER